MSRPVEVDATIQTIVRVLGKADSDQAFREKCLADIDAAIAELGISTSNGATFSYTANSDGQELRIERGDDLTICSLDAEGQMTIDSNKIELQSHEEELADEELLAVSGGGQNGILDECKDYPTRNLRLQCSAVYLCFGAKYDYMNWDIKHACSGSFSTAQPCTALNLNYGTYFSIQCEG